MKEERIRLLCYFPDKRELLIEDEQGKKFSLTFDPVALRAELKEEKYSLSSADGADPMRNPGRAIDALESQDNEERIQAEKMAANRSEVERRMALFAKLPPKQRIMVRLVLEEHLKEAQAARIFHVSRSAACQTIKLAIRNLRAMDADPSFKPVVRSPNGSRQDRLSYQKLSKDIETYLTNPKQA